MTYQSRLKLTNAIISYLLVFSLLASPAFPTRRVSAAPLPETMAQGATPTLTFTKSYVLQEDHNYDSKIGAGDTLRYYLDVSNTGTVEARDVLLQDILDQNFDLVPGSLITSPLAFDQTLEVFEDGPPVSFELTAADFDGDLLTYRILIGQEPVYGTLSGTPPNLTYQPTTPNFVGSDSFGFEVCDSGAPQYCDSATVQITIQPVNDAPTFTAGSSPLQVYEDSGEYVLDWASNISTGPANESSQTVQFIVTNNNNALFSVQPAISETGVLRLTPAANQYGQAQLSVILQDDGGTENGGVNASSAQLVTVEIIPINDAPSFTGGGNVSVMEDSGAQTMTGWATAINPGPNETSQSTHFVVVGNSNPGLFATAPQVTPEGALTFEPANDVFGAADITLRLADDGGTANGGIDLSAPYTFNIMVQENNDPPLVNTATFTIDENMALDFPVGSVTFNDPDSGQTHAFAILPSGNTGGAFSIDPTTGLISVAQPSEIDYETNPTFNLTVTVTDNAYPPATGSATITVNLNNVNDPPVVPPVTFTLPENSQSGVVVGTPTVTDDEANQFHTWRFTGGNIANAFAIDGGSGQISVLNPAALDFETNPIFYLTVEATDDGDPAETGWATVTVNLTNVNEAPQVSDASFSVNEFSPNGTSVGTLPFTDPDAGESHTIVIRSGNTDGAFAISNTGLITVANSTAIDYNANPSYSLLIDVTDSGTLTGSGTVTITVTDVNDTPDLDDEAFSVDENSPVGTEVGTLSFTDRDAGQTHTFSITGGNTDGAFFLNPTTGVLSVAGSLDYETLPSYTLNVSVTDNGTPTPATGTAVVEITVNNVNDPPVVLPVTFSVPENSVLGTTVGSLTVTDPETGQTHSFAIQSGNISDAFAIDSTGKITVAVPAVLNYEDPAARTFTLSIRVTDSGSPAAFTDTTATINLSDVNETPVINDFTFTLDENRPNATAVGQVVHQDPDAGQTFTYSILTGNTSGAFAIDNSGNITVANTNALDFETTPEFTLTVRVTDNGAPALSDDATVTITLINVNEAPIVGNETYQTVGNTQLIVAASTAVAAPRIFVVGNLLSNDSDPDAGDTLQCSLDGNPGGAVITVTPAGEFTYVPPAGATSGSFTYKVTDVAGLSTTGTVTIQMVGMVWYVNNTVGTTGLGRSTDPFATLAEAQTASQVNDTIYVYYGSGNNTGQTSGITLKAGQRLIGAGVALEIPGSVNGGANPTVLLPAGQKPFIANTIASGNGVTISTGGAEVRGLNIGGAANAIDVTYNGVTGAVVTVKDNTISATGNGFDMLVTAGSAILEFSNNTVTSGTNGVWIERTGGSLTITGFANNTVSGDVTASGATIRSVVFDDVPGDAVGAVNLGKFSAGASGNPVGGSGLVMTNTTGNLTFNELSLYAQGPYGLQTTGGSGFWDGRFTLNIASGMGTFQTSAGTALHLADLLLSAPNMAISSAGGAEGARFDRVNGSFSSTNTSTIANTTGTAFLVDGRDVNLVYNGTINQSIGRTVQVANRTGGSVSFTGMVTGGGIGVSLTNNTGSTVAFSGGLVLNTGTNAAFTATNAGIVTVTGSANTLTTTTGTAYTMTGSTIGTNGVTFLSVSANGAPVGISLENIVANGEFKVTGAGTVGSGGTIQNTSGSGVKLVNAGAISLNGMNINNVATSNPVTGTSCGTEVASGCLAAISMVNATNVRIDRLSATNSGQMGISASEVAGFQLTNSTITNAGNGNDEFALLLVNPTGTVFVDNSALTGMYEGGIRLFKNQGSLVNVTLRGVTLSNNNTEFGEDGFQFKMDGTAQANMLVENGTFRNLQRDGIDGVYQDQAALNLTVKNSLFENNSGFGGIIVAGNNTATGYLTLQGNTIRNTVSTPIVLTSATNALLDARVMDNIITNPVVPNPNIGEGIRLSQEENSTMTVQVSGNNISQVYARDITGYARLTSTTGSFHATVQNNTAQIPLSNPAYAMDFQVQDANHTLCLNISGNTATGNAAPGISVRNTVAGGIFQLAGAPSPLDPTAAANFIASQNTPSSAVATGSFTAVGAAACRTAVGATLPPVVMRQPLQLVQTGSRGPGLAKADNQVLDETVQVLIGRLPAGKSVRVSFDVLLANPLPEGIYSVENQATLSGSNFTSMLSDDPTTPAIIGDPTVTRLYNNPLAGNDLYTTNEDEPLAVAAPGLLSNDLAADGQVLTAVLDSGPALGSLTLSNTGGFTYTPPENGYGSQTFTYTATDGATSSSPALVTIQILSVNDAPVLDPGGNMQLDRVAMNDVENPGTLVSQMLANAGNRISDVDANALQGIAITAADTTHGQWQYSTTSGLSWIDLGAVDATSALLLNSDAVTRVRFVPAISFFGDVNPAITFRAWDRTLGTNGSKADVTVNGGITPFSTAIETAGIEVYPTTDLVMEKTVSDSETLSGNQIVYTLTVTNQGLSRALDVTIADALPDAVSLVSTSTGCSEVSGLVTCTQASLDVGASASFDLTVRVATDFTGTLINTATASTLTQDINSGNNADNVNVEVFRDVVVLDPDDPIDPDQWSQSPITQPGCGSSFLGEFNNETVTLTLADLPQHSQVILEFDLLLIRSWDGNLDGNSWIPTGVDPITPNAVGEIGPDQWNLAVAGQEQINTTFSNWDLVGFKQAYPGSYPGGDYQARTGAVANNSLCYEQDSTYKMRYTVAHNGADLTVDFSALGLQTIDNESWGLDNVKVLLASGADQKPYRIYLPLTRR